MSETEALPAHPNLDLVQEKPAKKRLEELRTRDPGARLADAQLAIARENGFSSWRKLKDRVDQLTDLPKLFDAIHRDDRVKMRALLKDKPGSARLAGSEGQVAVHVAAECNKSRRDRKSFSENKADPQAWTSAAPGTMLSPGRSLWVRWSRSKALVRNGIEPDFFLRCRVGGPGARPLVLRFERKPRCQCIPHRQLAVGGREATARSTADRARTDLGRSVFREPQWSSKCREGTARPRSGSFFSQRSSAGLRFTGRTTAAGVKLSRCCFKPVRILSSATKSNCTPRAFGICVASSWGIAPIFIRVIEMDPTVVNIAGWPRHTTARSGQGGSHANSAGAAACRS